MSRKAAFAVVVAVLLSGPLASAATIQGVVMSTEGQAISGAVVRAYAFESSAAANDRLASDAPEPKAIAEAVTDARGKFTIDIKAHPGAQILATAPGFAPRVVRAAADDDVGAIGLRSVPTAKGRVTLAGKPLPNALVVLEGEAGNHIARTDEEGRYEAPDPAKWAMAALVIHPQVGVFRKLRTGFAGRLPADLSIPAPVSIGARVVAEDGSTPVSGAAIRIDGWPAGSSGEAGSFTFERAPADWRQITASKGELFAVGERLPSGDLTLRLRRGSFISGTIRDGAGGRELSGASASVQPVADRFGNRPGDSVLADEKGRFRIGPLLPGAYNLLLTFPGYHPQREEVSVRAGETVDRAVSLARGAVIEGYVRDEKKSPVAGARIEPGFDPRRGPRAMWGTFALSAPDGRFVLRPIEASASLDLNAAKKDLPDARVSGLTINAGERKKDVVITMPSGVAVTVLVADANGRPVAGATIDTAEAESEMGGRMQIMRASVEEPDLPTTARDGTATLRLKAGRYDFTARAPGFAPGRARVVEVTERMEPVEIVVRPGADIRGRVVTSKGTPIDNVTVSAASMGDRIPASATTGPDGAFLLSDLEPGSVMLFATKREDFIQIQKMVEAPASDLVLETPAAGRITGRVIDKETKRPVTDFQAGFSGERGAAGIRMFGPPMLKSFSDAEGRFVIENAPVGKHSVVALAPGFVRGELAGVEVEDGKAVQVEISLDAGVRVTGKVTGPDGSAVAGASVNARAEGDQQMGFWSGGVQTDASGEYVLEGVEAGEKIFTFDRDGFVSESKRVKVSGKEARVDGRLGKGLDISGVVVDSSGIPLADARVRAQSATPGAGWKDARTDANGGFRIAALPPGRYTFRATRQGYAEGVVRDVDIAATPSVRIVMEAGGVIYGRVTGFRPEEAKDVVVSVAGSNSSRQARIDNSGNYRIEGAPTGSVTVAAMVRSLGNYSRSEEQRVEVSAGSPVQVDLALGTGNTISGRVTRGGTSVSGARVDFQPVDRRNRSMAATVAGSDGSYSVSGVQDGEYAVTVVETGAMNVHSTSFTVSGSGRFDIEMQSTPLRGTVVDAGTGEPIPGATVSLVPSGAPRFASATTDASGAFALEGVPTGTQQLRAEKKGYGQQILEVSVSDRPPQDLRFRLSTTEGARVRTVDGRDGRAVAASVAAFDGAGRLSGDAYGGVDGVVSLPLAPGMYRLIISASGLAVQNVRINVPGPEVTVALTPGGRLLIHSSSTERQLGRLLTSGGEPFLLSRLGAPGSILLQPGTNTFQSIAPGTYTIVLLDGSGNAAASKQVNVVEGRTVEVGF